MASPTKPYEVKQAWQPEVESVEFLELVEYEAKRSGQGNKRKRLTTDQFLPYKAASDQKIHHDDQDRNLQNLEEAISSGFAALTKAIVQGTP